MKKRFDDLMSEFEDDCDEGAFEAKHSIKMEVFEDYIQTGKKQDEDEDYYDGIDDDIDEF